MGKINIIAPVNYFCGIIYREESVFNKVISQLKEKLGEIDIITESFAFNFTDYYTKEMGDNLLRRFVSFKNLKDPIELSDIKILTNNIEEKYSVNGSRVINLDPGYVDFSKVVLASTKDFTHRLYIGKGIYAEVTMFYKDKKFNFSPWTYKDYQSKEYLGFFYEVRENIKNKRLIM
jgi:hypothetical protein